MAAGQDGLRRRTIGSVREEIRETSAGQSSCGEAQDVPAVHVVSAREAQGSGRVGEAQRAGLQRLTADQVPASSRKLLGFVASKVPDR